jgi:hypothetical protein
MSDEHPFTLRRVDLACADFAAIADDLDLLQGPARADTDAEGVGAHRARGHLRRDGAGDLVDRVVRPVARQPALSEGLHSQR